MLTKDQQYLLNHTNTTTQKVGLGDELMKTKNVLKCQYDFAVQGGAVSTISLYSDITARVVAALPAKAVITRSWVDIITTCTSSGSATVAAQAESAADMLAATAVASLTAGILEGKADGTAAKMIKTTVARTPKIVIAVAALTAGKFNLFLEYVISD